MDAGIAPSVGSQGDAYDNALAESVIGLFKTEVIRRKGPWRTLEAVEFATLVWVDWFNLRGSVTGSGSFIGAIGNETVSVDGTGVTVLPADLAGGWHGTATFNDADGCTGIANLALTLTGSNSLLSGPLSYTVTGSSGSDPACSLSSPNGSIGSGDTIQISGTAQNGSVSFGGGGAAAHRNLQLQRYVDGAARTAGLLLVPKPPGPGR